MGYAEQDRRAFHRDQSGQILLLFAAVLPVLLAVFALAVDLGGASITYHRAQLALDAAVFAGAQELDVRMYGDGQRVVVDSREAVEAAAGSLAKNMGSIPVQASFSATGDTFTGSGSAVYRTFFLGALGIPAIECRVSASAAPGWGIADENQ